MSGSDSSQQSVLDLRAAIDLEREIRNLTIPQLRERWPEGWPYESGQARAQADAAVDSLFEQLEALRECVRDYADPDSWNHVKSPDTGTAWEKVGGHPTPWVDAQHALDGVSSPASEPKEDARG